MGRGNNPVWRSKEFCEANMRARGEAKEIRL